jgi:hypothetical protein
VSLVCPHDETRLIHTIGPSDHVAAIDIHARLPMEWR